MQQGRDLGAIDAIRNNNLHALTEAVDAGADVNFFGAQFTCFTWYQSTNTDAEGAARPLRADCASLGGLYWLAGTQLNCLQKYKCTTTQMLTQQDTARAGDGRVPHKQRGRPEFGTQPAAALCGALWPPANGAAVVETRR